MCILLAQEERTTNKEPRTQTKSKTVPEAKQRIEGTKEQKIGGVS
jgi:hypothetical protein